MLGSEPDLSQALLRGTSSVFLEFINQLAVTKFRIT